MTVPGDAMDQMRRVAAGFEAGPEAEGGPIRRGLRYLKQGLNIRAVKGGYGAGPAVVLMLLGLVNLFDSTALSLAFPEIQRHFKLNLRSLLTLGAWVGLLGTLFTGPFAYLGDRARRTTLTGIGGLITSIGALLTSVVPTKGSLTAVRALSAQGDIISAPVQFSLFADYYPLEERGRVIAFQRIGGNIGCVLAPISVGLIGTAFGWQLPFVIAGAVGLLVSLLIFRLREPVRGYHERVAYGADEETARREQEPPSWGESWRAAWGIRTLRRTVYAGIVDGIAGIGIGFFLPIYFQRLFGLTLLQRGFISAAGCLVSIVGLLMGGPLVNRIIGRSPGRVVIFGGMLGIVEAFAILGMALTRNLGVALALQFAVSVPATLIAPARFTVISSVIPPRMRGLGISVFAYAGIPLFFLFPVVGGLGDSYGIRAAIAMLTPLAIIGSIVYMTAAQFVEFDIRSANAAAMAHEIYRRAKAAGRAKMLVMRELDVHYDTVQVLFGIDLEVDQGELVALLGTNGAGKSTLLKGISGVQPATGGAILFDGREITHVPPFENARYGIVHVPGGRGVFPGLTVKENLILSGWLYGQEPRHDEELEQVFRFFPVLRERLAQNAGTLSGGEQQMLVLAQAFLSRPKLLMIDELSLGLAPAVVANLLEMVRAVHERGTTIILVEQSVNIALTVAKRAIFMEKGEIRFDGPTQDLLSRPDIMRAVFLKGAAAMGAGPGAAGVLEARPAAATPDGAAVILEAHDLEKRYGGVIAVDGVSIALREGEVLGLIGPNGAGKTTVMEIVSGFVMPDTGRVIYDGQDITFLGPDVRARLRLIRRFQDANLFPSLTVAETLAVAFEREFDVRSIVLEGIGAPQARVAEQRVRRRVDRLVELMGLEAYRDKFIGELSTGTRRVVDIGCVLATEPRVLLLDEPSTGLAQREAENLAPLLQRVRRDTGCAMLIVEHDMPLISAVSDELIAMDLGRVVVRGRPEEVLEDDRVVRAYLGTSEDVIQRTGAPTVPRKGAKKR